MTVFLYLLPLGPIFDLVGYSTPGLRLFLIFGLLALPLCLKPSRRAGWLALGLAGVAALRAWLDLPPVAGTMLLLLAHQVIWTVMAPVPRGLRTGVAAYALLHVFLFLSPLGHPMAEWLAGLANQATEWITRNPVHIGWTWQNLGALLLFLALSVFSWDGSRVGYGRTGAFVLVALLVNALATAVLLDKVDFAAHYAWNLEFRDPFGFEVLGTKLKEMTLLFYPGILFLAYLAAYLVLHYTRGARAAADEIPPGWAAARAEWKLGKQPLVVAGLAALAVLVATPPTNWRRPAPPEMVFLNHGEVSFTSPDYTRFGKAAGGMFGKLPDYARLFGCKASVVREVPASLEPGQVLVLTNLKDDIGADTRRRIWKFVENGGALWVLGDHTFIKNGRNHINDFLKPCHISLNNDSAQFFPQGWFRSYQFRQGTPFGELHDDAENRPGLLVGASLKLGVPAEPFIVGRYAYADLGVTVPVPRRGCLGDFKYQPSERLGDLVLVAGERHGNGRVLVFGDTSSFFNGNLSRSYELLRASLSWLGETNRWALPASRPGRTIAFVLMAGFLGLLFRWRTAPVGAAGLAAAGLLSAIGHGPGGLLPFDQSFTRDHMAIVDFSHQPNASKHSSMGNSLYGLSLNLLRHELLPVTMNQWDEKTLDSSQYLILDAPRRPISSAEKTQIVRFMERGGTVILGCGHQDAAACRKLLDPLGIRIGSTPFGRFFDAKAFGQPVSFMAAWSIDEIPPEAAVLCARDGGKNPLILALRVGDGMFVLISDSEFLHSRNIEGHDNHDPANTTFLKNLLDFTSQ